MRDQMHEGTLGRQLNRSTREGDPSVMYRYLRMWSIGSKLLSFTNAFGVPMPRWADNGTNRTNPDAEASRLAEGARSKVRRNCARMFDVGFMTW
jgi:hypothetical protein